MDHLAEFLAVSIIVIVTPGPDTALTIRNTLLGDGRAGVPGAPRARPPLLHADARVADGLRRRGCKGGRLPAPPERPPGDGGADRRRARRARPASGDRAALTTCRGRAPGARSPRRPFRLLSAAPPCACTPR